jgi:hypothetical protein
MRKPHNSIFPNMLLCGFRMRDLLGRNMYRNCKLNRKTGLSLISKVFDEMPQNLQSFNTAEFKHDNHDQQLNMEHADND